MKAARGGIIANGMYLDGGDHRRPQVWYRILPNGDSTDHPCNHLTNMLRVCRVLETTDAGWSIPRRDSEDFRYHNIGNNWARSRAEIPTRSGSSVSSSRSRVRPGDASRRRSSWGAFGDAAKKKATRR